MQTRVAACSRRTWRCQPRQARDGCCLIFAQPTSSCNDDGHRDGACRMEPSRSAAEAARRNRRRPAQRSLAAHTQADDIAAAARLQLVLYGPGEVEGLTALGLGDRVHVVPFGVDASFWTPGAATSERDVLAIGNDGHRDWETLVAAARTILGPGTDLHAARAAIVVAGERDVASVRTGTRRCSATTPYVTSTGRLRSWSFPSKTFRSRRARASRCRPWPRAGRSFFRGRAASGHRMSCAMVETSCSCRRQIPSSLRIR